MHQRRKHRCFSGYSIEKEEWIQFLELTYPGPGAYTSGSFLFAVTRICKHPNQNKTKSDQFPLLSLARLLCSVVKTKREQCNKNMLLLDFSGVRTLTGLSEIW